MVMGSPENTDGQKTTTVLLVNDHAIWREGVRSMLEETEFTVIGEAGSGSEAIDKARELTPQLILLGHPYGRW